VVFGLLSSSQVMSYPLFSAMTKPMVNCSETEREKDTHTHTYFGFLVTISVWR
jgi:hypothetical protein